MSIEKIFTVTVIVLTIVVMTMFLYSMAEMSNQGCSEVAEYLFQTNDEVEP